MTFLLHLNVLADSSVLKTSFLSQAARSQAEVQASEIQLLNQQLVQHQQHLQHLEAGVQSLQVSSFLHHTLLKVACMVSLVDAVDAFIVSSLSLSIADRKGIMPRH
jgi:hypothetical protein